MSAQQTMTVQLTKRAFNDPAQVPAPLRSVQETRSAMYKTTILFVDVLKVKLVTHELNVDSPNHVRLPAPDSSARAIQANSLLARSLSL